MIYLNIVVEGQTELGFVKEVLTSHLAELGIYVSCQMTHTGGTKTHPKKGGLGKHPKYRPLKRALTRWMETQPNRDDVYYTTFIDLYAFPKDSESPYILSIQEIQDKYDRIVALENAMKEDINHTNFIPYIQLHEFETFLLADLEKVKVLYPDRKTFIDRLIREIGIQNIELINDTPQNAPSKRIIRQVPDYEGQKNPSGFLIAGDIGIPILREKCRHFNDWLIAIEGLSPE